jgi:hypothetical protein
VTGNALAGRLGRAVPEAATTSAALAEAHRQRDAHAAAIQLLLAENRELRGRLPVAVPGPATRLANWVQRTRRLLGGRAQP